MVASKAASCSISQRVYQSYNARNIGIPQAVSPGPIRSPTDISLAQLAHIPSHEDAGEGSSRIGVDGEDTSTPIADPLSGAPVDHEAPPPEYSSPESSRRGSDASLEFDARGSGESSPPPNANATDLESQNLPSYQAVVDRDFNERR
jgi:hypothetical protein